MLFGLFKSKAMRAAEHDAAYLVAHYGADAERFCETVFSGPGRPSARRAIRLIRAALREGSADRIKVTG